MRLIEFTRTTSFRLALAFLTLFSLTSIVLFAFIDRQVKTFMVERVDEWVVREGKGLSTLAPSVIRQRLANRNRENLDIERPMVLYDVSHNPVAGRNLPFPEAVASASVPFNFGAKSGQKGAPFRGLIWSLPNGHVLLVAQSIDELQEFSEVLFGAMILAGSVTAFFGLAGAIFIGVGALRHYDAVSEATRRIMAGDLSERLPAQKGGGDTGRLVAVVNDMLDEIERLMREVKGVCDNIAHDMRTPLTRLLAGLERTRRRAASEGDYRVGVDDAISEMQGILKTFAALLRISEIEDGARRAGFVPVDLAVVVADAVDLYEPLAEKAGVRLLFDSAHRDSLVLSGDPGLLFEAVANLLDNAIKFAPHDTTVELRILRCGAGSLLTVKDEGPGIPVSEHSRVLRRFYRSEPSRHTPGNGLGLSLVAAIARLHGLALTFSEPPGCTATLRLDRC